MEDTFHHKGLTSQEVEESRSKHGSNILTPPEKVSLWKLFLEKFEDPIIRILLLAWILSMIISGVHCWGPEQAGATAFLEPVGIFFAIVLASTIGFIFEVKANKEFDVLNKVNDDIPVTVVRNGKITEVMRKDIVVGDVVILNTGDEIPADGNLIESVSLQVNESTLTGEPLIGKTTVEADFDTDATYPSNRVLRGTTVVDGHATMIVDAVGDSTEYGNVNQGAQMDNDLDTPLQNATQASCFTDKQSRVCYRRTHVHRIDYQLVTKRRSDEHNGNNLPHAQLFHDRRNTHSCLCARRSAYECHTQSCSQHEQNA